MTHSTALAARRPVLVVVMDGVGIGAADAGDAVNLAYTPTLDRLTQIHPHTNLAAHGLAVGLPSDDDMGNSEVGHNALGAGRVFAQGAKLVGAAIRTGALYESATYKAILERTTGEGTLHFIGLLSDGNVHSHIDHLVAMLRRAADDGVRRVRIHALLDGRDVSATSALIYVDQLESVLATLNADRGVDFRIASGGGRMRVTMDRYEADWAMVELGWKTHVLGQGRFFASTREAIETFRAEQAGVTDQFLPAFVIGTDGAPVGAMADGDAAVFFNFRGDRAIEISRAFDDETFTPFERGTRPDVLYAGMMQYDGDLNVPNRFLVEPPQIERTMTEYLSKAGLRQFACAETQKFGHVTYFWNGNNSGKFEGEVWHEVPSDTVPFEERPWMKAAEVTDATIGALEDGFDMVRINYANGDMVGHTGDRRAAILAVEAVDLALARLEATVQKLGGTMIITADHGNADQMYEIDKKSGAFKMEDGRPKAKTSHTLNPVPCVIADYSGAGDWELDPTLTRPGLSNIAATVFELLGLEAPADYDASLIRPRSEA